MSESLTTAEEAQAFTRSAKWIWEELERTPHEFGESRAYDEGSKLNFRVAYVGPFVVYFAIHEETRTVFVGALQFASSQ